MTFRAKPVVKRAHRPAWEAQDRRNFYLNLGFGLIVVLAVLILAIAAGLAYYNDHLASVGSVDGQSISKDDLNARIKVDAWRLDEADRRSSTAVLAGHMTEAQAATQKQTNDSLRQQLPAIALEHLIDAKLQAKLAAEQGVSVAPADVDARLVTEATTPELRHAYVIEVKPATDLGAVQPTAGQIATAKATAENALKDITGGKSWDDVAKTVSTDASTAAQGGDLGWIDAEDKQADEAFVKAVFGAEINKPTEVVEGADGIFRIGRVTETSPESVDSAYQAKIVNDGVPIDLYRTALTADVLHDKLQTKIVADVTGPGPQRRVSEIYIPEPTTPPAADAVKARHIQYSPKGDASGASALAADDPAWEAAHAKALAAYTRLKENPSLFDSIARTESDEAQAQGPTGTGGKLPFVDSTSSFAGYEPLISAILTPGIKDGEILEPVKTDVGWHIVQRMYDGTDADHLKALKTQADAGSDFALLARDNSTGPSAGTGGDMGWIAKGQLTDQLETAIFAAPIGKTSDVVTMPGDGSYLFKVIAEENRTPAGRQLQELTSTAFSKWYDAKKAAVTITRDPSISASSATS
jgi:parvulin-like peptidyl-prolyl isomerase